MEWFPLADRVGAEVRGVDLATVEGPALDALKAAGQAVEIYRATLGDRHPYCASARFTPTSRGSSQVPPASGMRPTRAKPSCR